jgi:chromosome partitioning protein
MKIIAFSNQKGGVGKTTTAVNLSVAMAMKGKKILAIDLDPQAHLTSCMGVNPDELEVTIHDAFKDAKAVNKAIIEVERAGAKLWLLPSSLNFSSADLEFAGVHGREYLLKDAIGEISDSFDYIFIDCPPTLALLTVNALTAATDIYIPLQTEYLSMQGMSQMLKIIEIVKHRMNKDVEITGVIGTMYDGRKKLDRQVLEKVQKHFSELVFDTIIRTNVSLAEAPSFHQDIFTYKADSTGAEDYLALADEIIKRS